MGDEKFIVGGLWGRNVYVWWYKKKKVGVVDSLGGEAKSKDEWTKKSIASNE